MRIYEVDRTNADIVLALIKRRMDEDNNAEFELDFYNNGRERGYVLKLRYVDNSFVFDNDVSRWIAFSENRNSDSTVVYTDCGYWNEEITEKSWKEAVYFNYSDFIKASDYIIGLMEESVEAVREKRKKIQVEKEELEGVK